MTELTTEQKAYLHARGFERKDGNPPGNEMIPYVILREPQKTMFESEAFYAVGDDLVLGFSPSICHPTTRDEDYLAGLIAKNVSDYGIKQPSLVPERRPIRVFVIDNAWDGVVQKLLGRYGHQTL